MFWNLGPPANFSHKSDSYVIMCDVSPLSCQNEIRSSLVLSMLQQMVHEEKTEEVRESVVKSLGLLMGFIDDPDKFHQVS